MAEMENEQIVRVARAGRGEDDIVRARLFRAAENNNHPV